MKDSQIAIPESIRLEHEKIHTELVRATQLSGPVGAAACCPCCWTSALPIIPAVQGSRAAAASKSQRPA